MFLDHACQTQTTLRATKATKLMKGPQKAQGSHFKKLVVKMNFYNLYNI
jgi:hypothetical protein